MDPNETLRMIRRMVESVAVGADTNVSHAEMAQRGVDLAEYVAAMDEWLSKGGFLPGAWDHS